MTPLSGSPSQFTVSHTGNVSTKAIAMNTHDARNLPTIACHGVTGNVSNNSTVPLRRSSDHRRMPTAGTRNRNSHGSHIKNEPSEASPRSKNAPNVKVKNPANNRKMTMKT